MPVSDAIVRKELLSVAQLKGFSVRPDAVQSFLQNTPGGERESLRVFREWLAKVMDTCSKMAVDDASLDGSAVLSAINAVLGSSRLSHVQQPRNPNSERQDGQQQHLHANAAATATAMHQFEVVMSWDVPRFSYNLSRANYTVLPGPGRSPSAVFAEPAEKVRLFKNRLQLQRLKTTRSALFAKDALLNSIGSGQSPARKLLTVESLLGDSNKGSLKMVMGLLTHIAGVGSEWVLEDDTAVVPLDLSSPELEVTSGFFTEDCIVLCEGDYVNGTFVARVLAMPPAELRASTVRSLMSCNPGYKPLMHPPANGAVSAAPGTTAIVVAEPHLDDPQVLDSLSDFFQRLEDSASTPGLMVLCGNFLSHPFGSTANDRSMLTSAFSSLADVVSKFPFFLRSTHFVFVPGPGDPCTGSSVALPRYPLPASFVKPFVDKVGRASVTLATNPVHLRASGRTMVVFRQNLLAKMRRHCVVQPSTGESSDLTEHLVKSVVEQAHLSPLPLVAQPICWASDQALYLYPLPDILVLADACPSFALRYEGCLCANPGPFDVDAGQPQFLEIHPQKDAVDILRL